MGISKSMPSGWGYAQPRKAPAAKPTPAAGAATRKRASNDRQMHMRFALWASRLGREPMPGEVCDVFGVCLETSRRLLWDWKKLNKETP